MGLDNYCYKLPVDLFDTLYNNAISTYEEQLKNLNEYWSSVYEPTEGSYLKLSVDDFCKFTSWDPHLYDLVEIINDYALDYGQEFLEPDPLLDVISEIYKYDKANNENHEIDSYRKHYDLDRAFQKAGAIIPLTYKDNKISRYKLVCILTTELLNDVSKYYPDIIHHTFYKDFMDNNNKFVYLWVHSS